MAAAVAPHVTVVHEATERGAFVERLRAVAPSCAVVRLGLGPVERWHPPEDGLFLPAFDLDGALAALRNGLAPVIAPPPRPGMTYHPHVTLLHPGTCTVETIDAAHVALEAWRSPSGQCSVDTVTVIHGEGLEWEVIDEVRLGQLGEPSGSIGDDGGRGPSGVARR
jgi:hypothetical protein